MLKQAYNPDVLTCLANLSSDEVFTPPTVVNQMLDTLPKELWSDEKVTFLDPVSKSGVFLREITKRLIGGLERKIPNLEERIEHILRNQVFGIGITELTSLISRRSLYCSKYANGEYSIVQFDDEQGNLKYFEIEHTWEGGSCKYCGVSKEKYDRGEELESYAYSFIHSSKPNKLFNMKFDVIIGNPPYQMNTGVVKENYAVPIFQKFVRNAKKLNPKYLTMIIPARWYTGGRGLNDFRMEMKSDKRISKIVDFIDSRDCFPGVDVSGGIMYFLWDKNHEGKCEFTNIIQGESHTKIRDLSKESVIVRMNNSQTIIEKVKKKSSSFLDKHVSPQTPFGLHTNFVGYKRQSQGMIKVKSSKGIQYIEREKIKKNTHLIDRYKVSFSKATSEHGGQQSKNKSRLVFSSLSILEPGEICTQSYLVVSIQMNKQQSDNLLLYLKTKFLRFLLFQSLSSQDISRDKFCFVPELNLNTKWTDEILYEKFELNDKEITLIENTIREIN